MSLPALPHAHLPGRIVRLRHGTEAWAFRPKSRIGMVAGIHQVDLSRTHLLVKCFGSPTPIYQFRFEIEVIDIGALLP